MGGVFFPGRMYEYGVGGSTTRLHLPHPLAPRGHAPPERQPKFHRFFAKFFFFVEAVSICA